MTADHSDQWTCKKCGVTFTRHEFVQHVRADVCSVPRHAGQLIQSLGASERLPYQANGRAFQHPGERRR